MFKRKTPEMNFQESKKTGCEEECESLKRKAPETLEGNSKKSRGERTKEEWLAVCNYHFCYDEIFFGKIFRQRRE